MEIMGSAATEVSVEEYLTTSYRPDMEFVDGVLLERNVGTQRHGLLQSILASYLRQYRKSHQIHVFTDTRLLVDAATRRYRIPDVLVLALPYRKGRVVTDVPIITIEVKSPEDTFDDIVGRCFDYEKMGVANIVVMDPDNLRVWVFEHGNLRLLTGEAVSLTLHEGSEVEFQFGAMFSELDEE